MVEDDLDTFHRPANDRTIPQVALDELGTILHSAQVLQPSGRQVVKYPHTLATRHQRLNKVRADKPCPTGHQLNCCHN
jgi:hypothetical protein